MATPTASLGDYWTAILMVMYLADAYVFTLLPSRIVGSVMCACPGQVQYPNQALTFFDGDAKLSTYVNYPTPRSATASRNIRTALDKVTKVAKQESKQPT